VASIAVAFIVVGSIAVAFIVVPPCAAEWRWASELPQWEQVLPELTEPIAADTIPMDLASRLLLGPSRNVGECSC
jgi:hypothetical protein